MFEGRAKFILALADSQQQILFRSEVKKIGGKWGRNSYVLDRAVRGVKGMCKGRITMVRLQRAYFFCSILWLPCAVERFEGLF